METELLVAPLDVSGAFRNSFCDREADRSRIAKDVEAKPKVLLWRTVYFRTPALLREKSPAVLADDGAIIFSTTVCELLPRESHKRLIATTCAFRSLI